MAESTEERWVPVVGYEGLYEVSDMGRVRSVDRIVARSATTTRKRKGVILSAYKGSRYEIVTLSSDGVVRSFSIHGLVAAAFLGPRPYISNDRGPRTDGLNVLHCNGDSHDNRVANLRYGTQSENILDSVDHGTHLYARRSHCKRGHEYTPDNTKYRKTGARMCVQCSREDSLATYYRYHAQIRARQNESSRKKAKR